MDNIGSNEYFGKLIARKAVDLYNKAEEGELKLKLRWPLIDPNKITAETIDKVADYLGSEAFLGTAVYTWKEMRKMGREKQ